MSVGRMTSELAIVVIVVVIVIVVVVIVVIVVVVVVVVVVTYVRGLSQNIEHQLERPLVDGVGEASEHLLAQGSAHQMAIGS